MEDRVHCDRYKENLGKVIYNKVRREMRKTICSLLQQYRLPQHSSILEKGDFRFS